MNIVRWIVTLISIFVATAVMSYIAMATPIGPWIESTLVLIGMLIFAIIAPRYTSQEYTTSLGLATASGGIGGILATACGFTVPTLYFIAPEISRQWLAAPSYFCLYLLLLSLAAGSLGLVFAHMCQHYLLYEQKMPFAIGELVYKLISAQDRMKKAWQLAIGFISTALMLYIRHCLRIIPAYIVLISKKITWGIICMPRIALPVEQMPMFLAIGFVAGHVIALSLLVGLVAKIICLDTIYNGYSFFYGSRAISSDDFTIAFGSGMVLYSAIMGFIALGKNWYKFFKTSKNTDSVSLVTIYNHIFTRLPYAQISIAFICNGLFFWYFQFSFSSQVYILLTTGISIYQLLVIAGRMGIAPVGRFATFVLVPGMFLFGFNAVQIMLVSAFVEIAGGVACDALFGRKMAALADISPRAILRYQWAGLIISSMIIGLIFFILIHTCGLGNQPDALAATKAASRALLVSVKDFDILALIAGGIFGYILSWTAIPSLLVLGGILMAPQNSLMLVAGGLSAYLVADKERYYPFWSGIFAANSLWMLVKAFIRVC